MQNAYDADVQLEMDKLAECVDKAKRKKGILETGTKRKTKEGEEN